MVIEQEHHREALISWRIGGGIVAPVGRAQLPPHELPPEAKTVQIDGLDAYHVTLIRRSVMVPHEQVILRVWSWITNHTPRIPEPRFSAETIVTGGEDGAPRFWIAILDNQDEYQTVVDELVGVVDHALRSVGCVDFIHKPLDKPFHVTLANNLYGDPFASRNRACTF